MLLLTGLFINSTLLLLFNVRHRYEQQQPQPLNDRQIQHQKQPREAVEAEEAAAPAPVDIGVALGVLQQEADALLALREYLSEPTNGESFAGAVGIIEERVALRRGAYAATAAAGRVVVTGMGKSGLIGAKIAATLSSTGTPSFFIHPGEASHGDLGMISPSNDVILALSKSGNTQELRDILYWSKHWKVPIVGITSDKDSMLGELAGAALLLPKAVREACPNGLAPTTSSTMMLALGDALAVTLSERKKFTKDDFKSYHPGGQLGKMLAA